MKLTSKEKIYLKRYLNGSMTLSDFKFYLEKGYISQKFYDYLIEYDV